jgi:hypothetical protein
MQYNARFVVKLSLIIRCYNDFMVLHEGRWMMKGERLKGCLGVCWSDGGQDGEVLVHERGQQQGVGRPQVRTSTEKRSSVKRVNPACTFEDRSCTVYCTVYCTVDVPAIVLSTA